MFNLFVYLFSFQGHKVKKQIKKTKKKKLKTKHAELALTFQP